MTIIAYDGKSIAVDSIACNDSMKFTLNKYKLFSGEIINSLYLWHGEYSLGLRLVDWHWSGGDISQWPSRQYTDAWTGLIVVHFDRDHRLIDMVEYEQEPYPEPIDTPFLAWGSGEKFAMGAMAAGANAKRAAEIACELCTTCGGPVVSWDFMPS